MSAEQVPGKNERERMWERQRERENGRESEHLLLTTHAHTPIEWTAYLHAYWCGCHTYQNALA